MQLGFVTAILPELSLDEVLAFAAAEGFACVEAMCWPVGRAERKYAGVTHVDVTDFTPAKADAVLAACDRHGVALSGLGYYPNALDPDPAVADVAVSHLRRLIAAAPLLGLQTVNGFVGRDWLKTVDDNWPRFLATWRPLVKLAEDQGVRIGIENCPMLFTKDEWPGGKNLLTTPAMEILARQAGLTVIEARSVGRLSQFTGSERYRRDITANGGPRDRALFSAAQLAEWRRRTDELNEEGQGDQTMFFLARA